jgi:hypothetical protein
MISCYNKIWPGHPFTFRIPYQDNERCIEPDRREYIRTPPEIKATVLALLHDLGEDEWVYWCIDDKYPIQLNLNYIETVYQSIIQEKFNEISGILFCRARKMLDPEYLAGEWLLSNRDIFLVRTEYKQIWIHQFLKVKVLRYLFSGFPDIIEKAKEMDDLKDQTIKPPDHILLVTENNHAVFGESTISGVFTENCLMSMSEHGIHPHDWQTIHTVPSVVIGKL